MNSFRHHDSVRIYLRGCCEGYLSQEEQACGRFRLLIDKTNLVADAKLKEQASLKEIVLLQDNFSASLESPEDQDLKASIAAALQSDTGNRSNTSKCDKYLSVEHTLHAWGSSIAFLQATSMLYALHSGEAERGHVGDSEPCLKDDWGSGACHLGEAFCWPRPAGRVEET